MTRVEPHDKENYAEIVAVPAPYKVDTWYSLLNPEKLKTGYFVTYKPLAEGVLVQIVEGRGNKFRITKDHGDGTYDLENTFFVSDTREKLEKDKLLTVEVQWKGEKVSRTE